MAHFAKLDENNIVECVVVISNEDIIDEAGAESESLGIELCKKIVSDGTWVQTSYNGQKRGRYANPGMTYDEDFDVFMYTPRPYPSWVVNERLEWEAPILKPEDGNFVWDEYNRAWIEE